MVEHGNLGGDNKSQTEFADDAILLAQATPTPVPAGDTPPPATAIPAPEPTPPAPNAGVQTVIEVSEGSILRLPADASIDQQRVNGDNLEFVQPDGSVIVVPNGAIQGLTIFIGAIEIPPETVAALFDANGIQTAAGPAGTASQSSGGNFERPVGDLGTALDFGGLLAPTELAFAGPEEEELLPANVAPHLAFSNYDVRLSEEGLSEGNLDSDGNSDFTNAVVISGNLGATDPNPGDHLTFTFGQPGSELTSNGVPITWAGIGTSVLIGSAGGAPVIVATLSGATGSYTITLLQPLDHVGAGEDELSLKLPVTVSDGLGGTAGTTITLIIEDDSPVVDAQATVTLDEDGLDTALAHGNGNTDSPGDAIGGVSATGTLGIHWGADSGDKGADTQEADGTFHQDSAALGGRAVSFTSDAVGVTGNAGVGLHSNGDLVTFALDSTGTILVGTAGTGENARTVIEISLSDEGNGKFNVQLFDNLDHAVSNTEDDIVLNFGFTARDADGDTVNGSFVVTIDDDMPILVNPGSGSTPTTYIVDEDDLNTPLSTGTDTTGQAFVSGSLAAAVSFGADGQGGFEIASTASETFLAYGLSSQGVALHYAAGAEPGSFVGIAGDRTVFEFKLNAQTGEFEFRLYDQLDHQAPASGADENLDLRDGDVDLTALDFGAIVRAVDADGDYVDLAGKLNIAIRDDVPVLVSQNAISHIVDEDDIQNSQSQGTSPQDGNGDGSYTQNAGDNAPGAAHVFGTLNALVKTGADEGNAVKFSLIDEAGARAALTALGLQSQGGVLSYAVVGDTLYGFVNAGQPGTIYNPDTDRLVFELKVEADGKYDFLLHDQLDHDAPTGNVLANQNTGLVDSAPGDVTAIDFGQLIKATDFDGDSVVLKGGLNITIRDDVPELIGNKSILGVVEEEQLSGGNEDFNSVGGLDRDHGQPGNDYNDTTLVATGNSLLTLVKIGADEKATVTLDSSVENERVRDSNGNAVTSHGDAVRYDVDVYGDRTVYEGRAGTGENDRLVFRLTVEKDGDWKFELIGQLDHKVIGPTEESMTLDFSRLVKITDFDGDTVRLGDHTFQIKVVDDVPVAGLELKRGAEIVLDETRANSPQDTYLDGNADDEAGVSNPLGNNAPALIAYAKASASSLFTSTASVGADQNGSIAYSLRLEGNGPVNSGIDDTATGQNIYLYKEGNDIVGRVGNSNGAIAFLIRADSDDGDMRVYQFRAVEHDNNGSSQQAHDESLSPEIISSGKISLVQTVTDADGDKATDSVDIGSRIKFEDDGPVVSVHAVSGSARPDIALALDETIDGDRYNTTENPHDNNGAADDTGQSVPVVKLNPVSAEAIGSTTTTVSGGLGAFFNVATNYGSDGAAHNGSRTDTLSLDLSGDGKTNLVATALAGTPLAGMTAAQRAIVLVEVSPGVIEGRIVGAATHNDDFVAFRITLHDATNPSGAQVTIEQFLAIDHGGTENPSQFDEQIALLMSGSSKVELVLTTKITDGDGDTATDSARATLLDKNHSFISFDDDAPTLTVTAPVGTDNGLFFDGFTPNNNEWGTGSGVATPVGGEVHAGAWIVTGSSEGAAANLQLEKVGDLYRGADSPTDSVMVDLEASPGNLQIAQTIGNLTTGETYELTFEIGKANDSAADSAKVNVWWGGQIVGTYTPVAGVMQTITLTVEASGSSGELRFEEVGASGDNTGTYLANVRLNDVIIVDETPGFQADSDEVASGGVEGLFGGLNAGVDPNMAAQYAQGTGAIVSFAANYGSDGQGAAAVYGFSLNATDSGLKTTDGQPISLSLDGGRVIGTYGPDHTVAFALHIDSAGVVTVAQFVSLQHPIEGLSHDEAVRLAANSVSVTVTVTDGDGDKATSALDISNRIRFDDDGPTAHDVVAADGTNLIVNGSFETGVAPALGNGQWSLYNAIDGWTNAGGAPFELQNGNIDGYGAYDGAVRVELDGDVEGNPDLPGAPATGATHASIQQSGIATQAGQSYELTFHYSARPDDGDGNSSGMKVFWNGVEVASADADAPGWQTITVTVIGTGSDTLTFSADGAGEANELGALIDDVSLRATVLDDEDQAYGIQGGPGDNGHGTIASGHLNFDAGADGLKAVSLETAVTTNTGAAVQVLYVDPASKAATAETVTFKFVADIAGGGTLYGYSAHFTEADGNPAVTLQVNAAGDYTATLHAPLNHPSTDADGANNGPETEYEDSLTLNFGYTVTDGDGDTDTARLAVSVNDDTPDAQNEAIQDVNEGTVVTGQLDYATGADGATLTHINGAALVFGDSGWSNTIDLGSGSLRVRADGAYEFTAKAEVTGTVPPISATYTITDGDGDQSSASLQFQVLDVNEPLVLQAVDLGTVEEEHGLPGGIDDQVSGPPDLDTDTADLSTLTNAASGTFADAVTGGDEGPLTFTLATLSGNPAVTLTDGTALTSGGKPVFFDIQNGELIGYRNSDGGSADYTTASSTKVFTLSLQSDGGYTLTLNAPVDHPVHGVEDAISIDFDGRVLVTDAAGPSADTDVAINASITVIDDVPVAVDDMATVTEAQARTINAAFVLDFSGSISNSDFNKMLDAATEAGQKLFENAGEGVSITVVRFAHGANTVGTFNNFADFEAALNISANNRGINDSGTNFSAALEETMDSFAPVPGEDNRVFFFSDGEPTEGGNPVQSGTATAWNAFVNSSNNIDITSIGIGSNANPGPLQAVDVDGNGNTVISFASFDAMVEGLTDVIGGDVSGNVLGAGEGFGADGGYIQSVTIDGTTYSFNGTSVITADSALEAGDTIAANGKQITIITDLGGKLVFNFAANGSNAAGDWDYQAPANVSASAPETIAYTLVDGDGDTASASLVINVVNVSQAPVGIASDVSGTEDIAKVFALADFKFTDADNDAAHAIIISKLPAAAKGILMLDGVAVTEGQSISAADISAGLLSFQPATNVNGAIGFSFQVIDAGSTDHGGKIVDLSPETLTLTLAAVNDAPTATITPLTYAATEQVNLKLHGTGLSVADVDAGTNPISVTLSATSGILTVTAGNSGITSVTGNGSASVTVTGTLAQINNLLAGTDTGSGSAGTIYYNANSDNPAASATLTLLVNDTGDSGSGGALTGSDTAVINIAPVNDGPTATNDGFTVSENDIEAALAATPKLVGNLITGGTPDSDPDGGVLRIIDITKPVLSESIGNLKLDSVGTQPLEADEIARYRIRMDNSDPALTDQDAYLSVKSDGSVQIWSDSGEDPFRGLGEGQTAKITFTYTLSDGQGGSDTAQATITINGSNDAAIITGPITGTVLEAGAANNGDSTATGNLSSDDPDDNDTDDSWNSVGSGGATEHGYGTYAVTSSGNWTYTLNNSHASVQALASGQTLSDSFTVTTKDGTPQVVTVTINGANDAPAAVNDTVLTNITDFSAINIPKSALLFNDTDVDSKPSVTGVSNPTGGTVTTGVVFTPSNVASGLPTANFSANSSDTGGFTYSDSTSFVSGTRTSSGNGNNGALQIATSGGSNSSNLTGEWSRDFTLSVAAVVTIQFDYRLQLDGHTDDGENARILAYIDGLAMGTGGVVTELKGVDNGNNNDADTGWKTFTTTLNLSAGQHTLDLSSLVTKMNSGDENATAQFDNVKLTGTPTSFGQGGFDYTISDGSVADTAHVDIHAVAGNTITGTSAGEILLGGNGDDTLIGNGGNDYLSGGLGNDILTGGDGNDILLGGAGYDELTGGAGADRFVLDSFDPRDLIADYNGGEGDTIDLSNLFDVAPGADVTNYVNYNETTGVLSVDKDGAGGGFGFVDVAIVNTPTGHPLGTDITLIFDDGTNEHTIKANLI